MADSPLRLVPMHVGICSLGENHVLGDDYSDDARVAFACYCFLTDGGPGRRVLIDLGPVGLDYLNDMFRRFALFRDLPGDPDATRQPFGNVFDWLARLHLQPDDINHIVFTHLHADHHGLTDGRDAGAILRFGRAKVHVSRRGWQHNLDARRDGRWASYVDFAFSDFLSAAERDGKVCFHDDDTVVDGVDVIYLGGHSVCSQAVRVPTAAGYAIITSDDIYRYDLLERGVLARLHTTPTQLRAATEMLVQRALEGEILLPVHEPLLAESWSQHGAQ